MMVVLFLMLIVSTVLLFFLGGAGDQTNSCFTFKCKEVFCYYFKPPYLNMLNVSNF
jgi:hypothetical protein